MAAYDASRPDYPWLKAYPSFADWAMPIPKVAAFKLLQDAVAAYPDNPCMEFLGKQWTYAETGALAEQAAQGFQKLRTLDAINRFAVDQAAAAQGQLLEAAIVLMMLVELGLFLRS